jgi:hypothetical protein
VDTYTLGLESKGTSRPERIENRKQRVDVAFNPTTFLGEEKQVRLVGLSNDAIWRFYDGCCSTLAKCLALTLKDPDKKDLLLTRILRATTESLCLWGDSFNPPDLDSLTGWSSDLREAIMQFLLDIILRIVKGTLWHFPVCEKELLCCDLGLESNFFPSDNESLRKNS